MCVCVFMRRHSGSETEAEIYGSRSKVRFNDLVGLLLSAVALSCAITCARNWIQLELFRSDSSPGSVSFNRGTLPPRDLLLIRVQGEQERKGSQLLR